MALSNFGAFIPPCSNAVSPLQPFDGLLSARFDLIHRRRGGVIDQSPITLLGVEKSAIEAHHAETEHSNGFDRINHEEFFFPTF